MANSLNCSAMILKITKKNLKLLSVTLTQRAAYNIYAEIKYYDYLKREEKEVEKTEKFRELEIPRDFDLNNLSGLSKELQEKMLKHKPKNIAQAMLISGITPAAISLLIFRIREFNKNNEFKEDINCC